MRQVREWIEEATSTSSWRHFDDLHVDEVLPDVARGAWIWEAQRIFDDASALREELAPGFALVLGFGLSTVHKPLVPDWPSIKAFLDDQGPGSPSLYLFERGSKELRDVFADTVGIEAPSFLGTADAARYRQVRDQDSGEYTRSLLLVRGAGA